MADNCVCEILFYFDDDDVMNACQFTLNSSLSRVLYPLAILSSPGNYGVGTR